MESAVLVALIGLGGMVLTRILDGISNFIKRKLNKKDEDEEKKDTTAQEIESIKQTSKDRYEELLNMNIQHDNTDAKRYLAHEKAFDEVTATNEIFKTAFVAILHDKLDYLTKKFQKRGAITLSEFSNLEKLYKPYRAMGGNGDIKTAFEYCEQVLVKEHTVTDSIADEMDKASKQEEYGITDLNKLAISFKKGEKHEAQF